MTLIIEEERARMYANVTKEDWVSLKKLGLKALVFSEGDPVLAECRNRGLQGDLYEYADVEKYKKIFMNGWIQVSSINDPRGTPIEVLEKKFNEAKLDK